MILVRIRVRLSERVTLRLYMPPRGNLVDGLPRAPSFDSFRACPGLSGLQAVSPQNAAKKQIRLELSRLNGSAILD